MPSYIPPSPSALFASFSLSPGSSPTIPTFIISPPSPAPTSPGVPSPPDQIHESRHRPLCLSEARQLTLLLYEALHPVRTSSKGLVSESIRLADELHEAGIRWDRRRRVMGMHLRGVWEEGEKLGSGDGYRAMERYIQGSFLSIASDPHPLDSTPIPIELTTRVSHTAALPKLTLQAGLALALGANTAIGPLSRFEAGCSTADKWASAGPVSPRLRELCSASGPGIRMSTRANWKDKKKTGLKIKTGFLSSTRTKPIQISSPTPERVLSFGRMRGRGWTTRIIRLLALRLYASTDAAGGDRHPQRSPRWAGGTKIQGAVTQESHALDGILQEASGVAIGPRSARRVSMGGWEVR